MYGTYDIPCELQWDPLKIVVTAAGGSRFHYHREGIGKPIEKQLISPPSQLRISPVEPFSTPKFLTPYLLLEFAHPVLVAPKVKETIFLTFPLDLGVHLARGKHSQLIDVFTHTSPKFTLYGDPRHGLLCKYWKSDVYEAPPEAPAHQAGVLQLQIANTEEEWTEVRQVVLNGYEMKIFYENQFVQTTASMKLRAGDVAETDFEESPPRADMQKSIEVFPSKKMGIGLKKFLMEQGL